MWSRCTNDRMPCWPRYGGRGIYVCDGWKDFETFLADMGKRRAGLTLDRVHNDEHYTCGHCAQCVELGRRFNCRWATRVEQVANRDPQLSAIVRPRGRLSNSDLPGKLWVKHRKYLMLWERFGDLYGSTDTDGMVEDALRDAGLTPSVDLSSGLGADNYREPPLFDDPREGMKLVAIGRRFGFSRERARQIEEKALAKLRLRLGAAEATGKHELPVSIAEIPEKKRRRHCRRCGEIGHGSQSCPARKRAA